MNEKKHQYSDTPTDKEIADFYQRVFAAPFNEHMLLFFKVLAFLMITALCFAIVCAFIWLGFSILGQTC